MDTISEQSTNGRGREAAACKGGIIQQYADAINDDVASPSPPPYVTYYTNTYINSTFNWYYYPLPMPPSPTSNIISIQQYIQLQYKMDILLLLMPSISIWPFPYSISLSLSFCNNQPLTCKIALTTKCYVAQQINQY